jgi:hypothetical protein
MEVGNSELKQVGSKQQTDNLSHKKLRGMESWILSAHKPSRYPG